MINVVHVERWRRYVWLRQGFSTRAGGISTIYSGGPGELNLGFTKDDEAAAVAENRRLVEREMGGEMATVRQVHGVEVKTVRLGKHEATAADGMVTGDAGVLLAIQVADCVPVLVADTRRRVVGAFHAGWRGTAAGVVEQGIAKMVAEFGCAAEDMVGAVGPSIGACCYAVGDELREAFEERFSYAGELFAARDGEMHLNLWEANRRQMTGAGLRPDAVTVIGECTACARDVDGRRKYFSHRVESGFTGRAMGLIGIAE